MTAKLYTVRFTTQKLVRKYDMKGKLESETKLDTPICHTALPYATAMSYSGCDNFQIEPYDMQDRFTSKGAGRDKAIGSGTKKTDWSKYSKTTGAKAGPINAITASKGKSKLMEDAAAGNLGAALNA